jgi:hypothetical protein
MRETDAEPGGVVLVKTVKVMVRVVPSGAEARVLRPGQADSPTELKK